MLGVFILRYLFRFKDAIDYLFMKYNPTFAFAFASLCYALNFSFQLNIIERPEDQRTKSSEVNIHHWHRR